MLSGVKKHFALLHEPMRIAAHILARITNSRLSKRKCDESDGGGVRSPLSFILSKTTFFFFLSREISVWAARPAVSQHFTLSTILFHMRKQTRGSSSLIVAV